MPEDRLIKIYEEDVEEVVKYLKTMSVDWAKPIDVIRNDLLNALYRAGA